MPGTAVALPGPPPVVTYTMSKAASAAITVTVKHMPTSYRRLGTVIAMNSWNQPAPSSPRRLEERAVDPCPCPVSRRTVQKPEQHPDPDEADRRQRRVEVAEPGAGHVPEADRRQPLVDEAVEGQQPAPDDPRRDERDDLGQEQDGPRDRPEPARCDPVDDARGHQSQRHGDEAVEEDEPEGVEQRLDELRLAEDRRRSSRARPTSTGRRRPSGTASTGPSGRAAGGRRRRT